MDIVVQKYGGSSVCSTQKIKRVAREIKKTKEESKEVVVIVSAMGDTTDELLKLAKSVSEKPDSRELDMLLNTGEQVSIALLTMALQDLGCPAVSLTGAQLHLETTASHQKARIKDIDLSRIKKELNQGRIVVVAGFQGVTEKDEYTTLGRGGSDTSAVALAAKLGAKCEIYTDVEGIYTCDPKLLPGAKKLTHTSYEELIEMASLGAEVIHPRAVELAQKYQVPLYIAESCSKVEGTTINGNIDYLEASLVTGMAVNRDDIQITLRDLESDSNILADVFDSLANYEINVDMISQLLDKSGKMNLSFTIPEVDIDKARELIDYYKKDWGLSDWWIRSEVVKVSVVGPGMRTQPGVAARVFRLLANSNIPILMVTTSEIKISWLVPAGYEAKAVKVVGNDFGLTTKNK
ncbi:MAG: aspartate kinase [Bacillota bacterium]